jgi:hypothetical protein
MNPYDAVLTDLRAKRDAMSELIAALENVQKLGAPALAFVEAPTAERAVSQSVSQSVSTRTVPRVKAKPTRRGTGVRHGRPRNASRDAQLVAAVPKDGIGFGALRDRFSTVPVGSLRGALARLVAENRLARHGEGRSSCYYPAGTTAKEAL